MLLWVIALLVVLAVCGGLYISPVLFVLLAVAVFLLVSDRRAGRLP